MLSLCLAEFQSDDTEIIDDEEFEYLKRVKDLKQQYRDAYDQLKQNRTEVDYLSRSVDRCREKLILDFETWYQDSFDFSNSSSNSTSSNNLAGSNIGNSGNGGGNLSLLENNTRNLRLSDDDIRDDVGAEVRIG